MPQVRGRDIAVNNLVRPKGRTRPGTGAITGVHTEKGGKVTIDTGGEDLKIVFSGGYIEKQRE
jgi:hypothetical protein